jgi:O-antigen ligase
LLTVLPWIAFKTLPSFKQKTEYMVYDWGRYLENEGETYSDSERWISLKTGWQSWQQHPWLGAGAGDLPAETNRIVNENYPAYAYTPKLPHNQFLYILAGTGLLGLGLSVVAFLMPLFAGQQRIHYLFAVFQILVFTSFLVEYTIETAMGVAWYLFCTLWFMQLKEG